MGCKHLEQKQVDVERIRLEQQPRHNPAEKERAAVGFHFNLDPPPAGESLFLVISNRAHGAVYRGPFKSEVTVQVDRSLFTDQGYDGLEFWLLRIDEKQLCIWTSDQGEPYWRPGGHVSVTFLKEPAFDKDGRPKRFDVQIR